MLDQDLCVIAFDKCCNKKFEHNPLRKNGIIYKAFGAVTHITESWALNNRTGNYIVNLKILLQLKFEFYDNYCS